MNDKVKQVLQTILEKFKSGDIPESLAMTMFPIADIPCAKWSILNRTLMFINGTADARGIRQWNRAKRSVKKGSKAFHILVPFIKKVENSEGDERDTLLGFGCRAVFKVEDTDGAPLDYQKIELPKLPLIERAKDWGISVKAIPGNYRYCGYFAPDRKEIALATAEEKIWFHELAHASHYRLNGQLKPGQDVIQEVVAELSAQALCRIVGKSEDESLGNSYRYIERYAEKAGMSPHSACLKVLSDTEKVLNLILKDEPEYIQTGNKIAT